MMMMENALLGERRGGPQVHHSTSPHYGDGSSLPKEVRQHLRSEPLFWAKTPSNLSEGSYSPLCCDELCHATLLGAFCPSGPCFWPHLIIFCLGPISCCGARANADHKKNIHWVITQSELIRASPGGGQQSTLLTSRALSEVTFIGPESQQDFCARTQDCFMTTPANILVFSPTRTSFRVARRDRLDRFYGCPSEFHRQLLDARDACAHGTSIIGESTGPILATATVISGENEDTSTTSRLQKIQKLKDDGIISQEEYDTQRQVIISSL
jgi:hypothetical protein